MIFTYDELKECVGQDIERFYKMGFNEEQIFPAVLNEYEHGENFCKIENICIHIFLILNYAKWDMNFRKIIEKLQQLMDTTIENEVQDELGDEYIKFITDFNIVTKGKTVGDKGIRSIKKI